MKKILLLLVCCLGMNSYAQEPLQFAEPEFTGHVLTILPGDKTTQLIQESLAPRRRATTTSTLFGIGKIKDEVVLNTPHSPIRLKLSDGIAFIVRVPDNSIDPMSEITVFKFETTRKRRQAAYASIGTFGDIQSNTLLRQPFSARRFGTSSYLIVLKEPQVGEYGILVNAVSNINVSTFGIDK